MTGRHGLLRLDAELHGTSNMRPPQIIATAEFSEDMVATLKEYFAQYAGDDGVLKVEVTTHGLYLKNPYGGRQFLGLARFVAGVHDRH